MSLSNIFSRRRHEGGAVEPAAGQSAVSATKALARFVEGLSAHPHPVVLDLGGVVGANVAFFGEELGCKIIVEDVATHIDGHVKGGTVDQLPAVLAERLPQPDETVDGILCWDLFDYLDRDVATLVAARLTRVLRPGGVLFAMFSTAEPLPGSRPSYTRYVVKDAARLEYRPSEATRHRQRPLPNREIQTLFEPLRVEDQFLLKTNMREVLLRKPAVAPAGTVSPVRS